MPIGKKEARKLLSVAKEARRAAKMEHMSVAFPNETVSVSGSHVGEHDGIFHTDDFIRDRTKIYRDGWIIHPLDEIIEALEEASK